MLTLWYINIYSLIVQELIVGGSTCEGYWWLCISELLLFSVWIDDWCRGITLREKPWHAGKLVMNICDRLFELLTISSVNHWCWAMVKLARPDHHMVRTNSHRDSPSPIFMQPWHRLCSASIYNRLSSHVTVICWGLNMCHGGIYHSCLMIEKAQCIYIYILIQFLALQQDSIIS